MIPFRRRPPDRAGSAINVAGTIVDRLDPNCIFPDDYGISDMSLRYKLVMR
jgi:hypothetical protein